MIPKIIHFCWLSNEPFPKKIKNCIDSWHKYLPDYQFVHWNLERFPIGTCKWVDQAFDAKQYAYAADYIRLFALFNYGGIYLDTDVEVLRSFDDFLELPYFISWEKDSNNNAIEMAALGCEKGTEWIGKCLEFYLDKSFINSDGTYNNTPLPKLTFDNLSACGYVFENVSNWPSLQNTMSRNSIYVFPSSFFSPKSYYDGKVYQEECTVCIHHFAGSWLTEFEKIKHVLIRIIGPNITSYLVRLKALFK